MRFVMRALVAGILMACCCGAMAAESGSSWWPFGHHAEATAAQTPTAVQTNLPPVTTAQPPATTPSAGAGPVAHQAQLPATASDDSHWMLNTPKKKVSWPKLHMPEMSKGKTSKSAAAATTEAKKNKWAEQEPVKPKVSPMQSVKQGANSVASGTKSAWNKTVAAVTPDDKAKKTAKPAPAPHVASRATSPSLWKKMFGAKEPELQQAQTVPDWLAQKRLDP